MKIGGRTVELFASESTGAPLVLLNGAPDEGRCVWERTRETAKADFSMACVEDVDWNEELTPWPGPAVFSGQPPFGGGADGYLNLLTGRLLPEIAERLGAQSEYVALAGYSLAGLFALYAMYKTNAFSRVASVSGSTWYPDFTEYAISHEMKRRPDRIYLSVGDREARTRNAAMRPVEENARRLYGAYRDAGLNAKFEMNRGGHFDDPSGRVARAIAWLLED